MIGEVGDDRIVDELEGGTALLGAGGQHGPNALAPATAGLAARALGDFAVDGQKTDLTFRPVVRRLDARRVQKREIGVAVIAESLGDVLGFRPQRRPLRHGQNFRPDFGYGALPSRWRRLPAAMPHAEQRLDLVEQPVAVVTSGPIRQRGEVLHVPDQVRPTQLQPHVGLAKNFR